MACSRCGGKTRRSPNPPTITRPGAKPSMIPRPSYQPTSPVTSPKDVIMGLRYVPNR